MKMLEKMPSKIRYLETEQETTPEASSGIDNQQKKTERDKCKRYVSNMTIV